MSSPIVIKKIQGLLSIVPAWGLSLFLILGFTYKPAFSQFSSFKFKNISAKDGLSQNTVTSIQQDIYGFMWFGTFNGLNRFDGYDFKVYLKDNDNPRSLSSSRVVDMCADSAENLWIRTIDEVYNRYNYETDDFDHFTADQVSPAILARFELRNHEQILLYNNHRFRFFYNVTRTFTYTNLFTGDSTDKVTNINDPYGIRDNYLIDLYIDRYNSLWVGSFSSGVYYADLQRKKFNHYLLTESNSVENNIRAIFQDPGENDILWLGTRDKGIIVFNRKTQQIIHHYMHDNDRPNSLVYNDVRYIFRDSKGMLWIGTKGGVDCFDQHTGRFTHIMQGIGNDPSFYIFNIYEDHRGTTWISTFTGLHKYDAKTNTVIRYGEEDGVFCDNSIRFITEDDERNLWIGTEVGGLTLLKRKPDSAGRERFESVRFMNDPANEKSLSDNRVYSYCRDESGTLWFGTGAGLNKYNPSTGDFTVIGLKQGLPNDMILGILSDKSGHIWVSHKRGISKIDNKSFSIMNYSVRDGLQDDEFNEDAYFRNPNTGEMFFGGPKGFNSFFPGEIIANTVPPTMMITNLYINGEPVHINDTINGRVILKRNIVLTTEIELTHKERSFSLVFAGLNFANPANHQYACILEGFDKDWIYSDAKMRRASYTNLAPGDYTFKVKACNSDGIWSNQPAVMHITILPPFWSTWWFRIFVVLFITGLTGLILYFRFDRLKRITLLLEEKVSQRTHELKESSEKIAAQYREIIDQNKVIMHINEEVRAQAELVEEQKSKIEKAYSELDLYRNKLEDLVKERTKELVMAKEKAEESDRLKSSFMANLSHEIRTPLNAIIGFSAMLGEKEVSDEDREQFNSIIQNSSNNLLELISDILDLSKIESGQIKLTLRPVMIRTIISNMSGLYNALLQRYASDTEKHLEFRICIDEDLMGTKIETDPFRLEQVISNLISNAVKFTDEGFIELGCKRLPQDGMLEFYVQDTGRGIKEEYQSVIFERFRKLEDDKTQVHRGTGLGLAISSQLVSLLGGTMNLKSKPGKGSLFCFTIPLVISGTSVSTPENAKSSGIIPDLSRCHILVAEDDFSNYLYLEKLLRRTRAKIVHAVNGKEVLDILRTHNEIRLILMDIKMPVMDGIESLREIKKMNIRIPVIAQTAHAFSDEIERIRLAGFDSLITKPIIAANLYRILNQCMAS